MLRSTSSSSTPNPPASVVLLMAKVISPGAGVTTASQIDRAAGSTRSILPLASERTVSSKSAGSAAQTRASGSSCLIARLVPAISPPPPQQLTTWSGTAPVSRHCAAISSPIVPWPAITRTSSNGGISSAPRSAAMAPPISSRLSL